MNCFELYKEKIIKIISELYPDLSDDVLANIQVETPKEDKFGDFSTNAAMVLVKAVRQNPREIAQKIVDQLDTFDDVAKTSIDGPGFINWFVKDVFWKDALVSLLEEDNHYGKIDLGQKRKVNIEYVSANPTGPLHLAHARGAVFGDALSELLKFAGFDVTKEYYINDAGKQVELLTHSVYWRYEELFEAKSDPIPDDYYPGDYLIPIAEAIKSEDSDKWLQKEKEDWFPHFKAKALKTILANIKTDLDLLGIHHDVFTSEQDLIDQGAVDKFLDELKEKGFIYRGTLEPPKGKLPDDWEPQEQILFRSTEFGDDVDRALKKSDNSWTYFASDIANHFEKFRRGYVDVINVWGADHAGYIKRCEVAFDVLTKGEGNFEVKLCQMVRLLDNGELIRMSKRAGKFLTLKDLLDKVGKDVVRFIMLTRRNDQHLDFDIQHVMDQSKENPVFYVQYAYARCCSVMRNAAELYKLNMDDSKQFMDALQTHSLDEEDFSLVKKLVAWPKVIQSAALTHEPHRIAFYLYELASEFHSLWNKGKDKSILRFIHEDNKELTMSRLALLRAVQNVIAIGLGLFGVVPKETM